MPDYNYVSPEIFTVANFFTPAECAAEIARAEAAGFGDAPIIGVRGPEIRKDVRNNTRVMIDDAERTAELWQRATDYLVITFRDWTAVGVNERLRYYRYDEGQLFDWHYDGAFLRPSGERSQLTFMIYLNDNFAGGETAFDDHVIVPQQGMALFFVHQILHKGRPVKTGRKYVLRTDVMYRPQAGK